MIRFAPIPGTKPTHARRKVAEPAKPAKGGRSKSRRKKATRKPARS